MTNFILFHVVDDKRATDITPTLIEAGFIASLRPTDGGANTRVLTRDGQAFKVTGKFEDFRDDLLGLAKQVPQANKALTQAAPKLADQPAQIIEAKEDELNEEETPVDKDKNKSLTQKKK